jgi:type VI secretion system secreted protein Hcp
MAVDATIKIEGPPLDGESVLKGLEKQIDVLAWSWGVSQSGTMHIGTGGTGGKANVQDLSVTKYIDAASPNLFLFCCNGQHIDKVTLTCRKAGTTPLKYVEVLMEQVIITSVSTGGSGGEDRFTENVTFNFAKVTFTYSQQATKGAAEKDIPMTWLIAVNADS